MRSQPCCLNWFYLSSWMKSWKETLTSGLRGKKTAQFYEKLVNKRVKISVLPSGCWKVGCLFPRRDCCHPDPCPHPLWSSWLRLSGALCHCFMPNGAGGKLLTFNNMDQQFCRHLRGFSTLPEGSCSSLCWWKPQAGTAWRAAHLLLMGGGAPFWQYIFISINNKRSQESAWFSHPAVEHLG